MISHSSKTVLLATALAVASFLASGCATIRETAEVCEQQTSDDLAAVFRLYESYRDEGLQTALVGSARRSLEQARFILFQDPGLPGSTEPCPPTRRKRPSWKDLRDDFEAAETLVRELEDVRGVRFVEVREGTLIFADATTGDEIPTEMAGSL